MQPGRILWEEHAPGLDLHSDNLDRLMALVDPSDVYQTARIAQILVQRIDKSSEYAPIGYFFLIALYRMGSLANALSAISGKLRGDGAYGFDDAVRMLSGLLQYEHTGFNDEMLDAVERFSETSRVTTIC
jgi:hypothetical protein